MRRYFILVVATIALAGLPAFLSGKQADADYSVTEVKELLKQPVGFSSSFSEKQIQRLGDRASIALMKIFSEDELTDPKNIKRFLPFIVDAFRNPNLIPIKDREPRVTLIFLKFLEARVPALQADIRNTEKTVQQETSIR